MWPFKRKILRDKTIIERLHDGENVEPNGTIEEIEKITYEMLKNSDDWGNYGYYTITHLPTGQNLWVANGYQFLRWDYIKVPHLPRLKFPKNNCDLKILWSMVNDITKNLEDEKNRKSSEETLNYLKSTPLEPETSIEEALENIEKLTELISSHQFRVLGQFLQDNSIEGMKNSNKIGGDLIKFAKDYEIIEKVFD